MIAVDLVEVRVVGNTNMSTKTKSESQRLIDLMVNEEDARRAATKTMRHASFKSAQQNTQTAQGIGFAMKLGMGIGALLVLGFIAKQLIA